MEILVIHLMPRSMSRLGVVLTTAVTVSTWLVSLLHRDTLSPIIRFRDGYGIASLYLEMHLGFLSRFEPYSDL